MAQDSLTKCLTEAALETLRKTGLSEDEYRDVMARLKRVAGDQRRSPEDRVIAVEQAILNARQDLLQQAVAALKGNEKALALTSDPRFRYDPENFESIAKAAENWRTLISNRRGGIGDTSTPTVYARMRSETRLLGARFGEIFKVITDTWPTPRDSEAARAFYMEMVGLDSGNAAAKAARDAFREIVGEYLERLRAAGIYTEKIENYFPQQHDTARIWSDKEGWYKFLIENLDPKFHPDARAAADALERAIVSRDVVETVGSRISMRRKIRFKSPEAELEYYYRFGHANVTQDMAAMVHKLARETVLAEELGPMSTKLLEDFRVRFSEDARSVRPSEGAAQRVESNMELARDVILYQSQPVSSPRFQQINNWMTALRLGGAGLKLGKVFVDSIVEDGIIGTLAGRAVSGGYWKSATSRLVRLVELLDKTGDARVFVEKFGMWQDTVMMLQSSRTIMDPNPPGFLKGSQEVGGARAREKMTAFAGFTQRISAAHWAENLQRSASFMQFHDAVAGALERTWDDLMPGQREVFANLGLTKNDWKVLQNSRLDPNLKIVDIDDLMRRSPQVARNYLAVSTRQAEIAVNFPDAESLLKAYGINRDDKAGVAWRFITQFWGWGWSVQRNAVMREVQAGVVPAAVTAGATLAASMVTLQLRELVSGKPAFEWDSPELWKRAMWRNVMLGPVAPAVYETFLSNEYFAGGFPGLVPGMVRRTATGAGRAVYDFGQGDTDEGLVEVAKLGRQFIPNWWMTDAATSHMVDAMIYELDPSELRKRNRRWREEERMGQ